MTKRTCLRCGSDRIIPNVPLADTYGDVGEMSDPLKVEVHGNPQAWLFKDTASGKLVAFICGACGHTELKTQGFIKLYRKYQESLGARPAEAGASEEAPQDASVCLSCGQNIPPEATRCSGCGWTWEEEQDD
jgi:uncharacterized OB-fold protein